MNYRFKKQLKLAHAPRMEFLHAGEELFLRMLRDRTASRQTTAEVPTFRRRILGQEVRYALGVAGMLVLFTGGGAVYADAQNVGPAHVLYPLKRAQESVRVALTSRARQSVVHTQLAKRRVQEALELREQNHPQKAQELAREAQTHAYTALETSESTKNENEACEVMNELVNLDLFQAHEGIEMERCSGIDAD